MDKFVIQGGAELRGEIPIGGAKNAALPAMAAALLTDREVVLDRIPGVRDIRTMARLLESIGATVESRDGGYSIRAESVASPEAPYDLVKTMRASSLVLGPLLARTGRGARLLARRMRDRGASHQPSPGRPSRVGCNGRTAARLRRGSCSAGAEGRTDSVRSNYGDGNGRLDDGGDDSRR